MFSAQDLIDLLRKHANKESGGLGLFIDDDDPKCVVLDGWVNLEAVANEISDQVGERVSDAIREAEER